MNALTLASHATPRCDHPQTQVTEAEWAMINHLRFVAMQCRVSQRADLFKACAALSMDRGVARTAHAEILVRTLSQSLDKPAIFLRPGVEETSFDEAWILQLARAITREDAHSAPFLLRSRVVPHARRNLAFLVAAISDEFGLI